MLKRLMMFAVAAGLFVGAHDMFAQCSKEAAGHCTGNAKCCAHKQEKATLSQLKMVDKQAVQNLLKSGSVTVVDARDQLSFTAGHIEGAINYGVAKLPTDKNAKLVFYCGGVHCPLSHKAAQKAIQMGYKNVMVYSGGWSDWSKNS